MLFSDLIDYLKNEKTFKENLNINDSYNFNF